LAISGGGALADADGILKAEVPYNQQSGQNQGSAGPFRNEITHNTSNGLVEYGVVAIKILCQEKRRD